MLTKFEHIGPIIADAKHEGLITVKGGKQILRFHLPCGLECTLWSGAEAAEALLNGPVVSVKGEIALHNWEWQGKQYSKPQGKAESVEAGEGVEAEAGTQPEEHTDVETF